MRILAFASVSLLLLSCGAAPAVPHANSATPTPMVADASSQTPLLIWHPYARDGSEEQALDQVLGQAQAAFPELQITAERIAFDAIFREYEAAVRSDRGPDLLLAPNDLLSTQVRDGLFLALEPYRTELIESGTTETALGGMTVSGQLYAFPQSLKTVALFYNKALLDDPPATTDELLALLDAQHSLIMHESIYHQFGWLAAFGGRLLDENGACIADRAGGGEWFAYLKRLKDHPNASFSRDANRTDATFEAGRVDMIINGPWMLSDYLEELGADLGVALLPGARRPAQPLTGVDGFFINAYGLYQQEAIDLARYMSSPEMLQIFTDVAGHVPVNSNVSISDTHVQVLAEAAAAGMLRPQIPELEAFWRQFDNALLRLLETDSDPFTEIATACSAMNRINGR